MQKQFGEYHVRASLMDWPRRPRPAPPAAREASAPTDSERRRSEYKSLMAAHEATLLRAALRLCRHHRDDAQDLVQETLIRGYQAYIAERFQPGTNARAWLLRILMNLFLNEDRRRKWNADIDLDGLIREGISSLASLHAVPADRPDTALLRNVLDEPLENALETLTEELRLCTMLVDVEELTYAEAAAILDIPIGTVRSRLWRARRLLHDYLRASTEFTDNWRGTGKSDRG